MNEMQVFKYEDNEVRTVEQGGEVWWVLADVCRVLEIQNNRNVARRLDEDEKGVHLMDTLGGGQKLTIISESGLYKVILRSDKPEAKKFTRWVTHEVLPSIRRMRRDGEATHPAFPKYDLRSSASRFCGVHDSGRYTGEASQIAQKACQHY